MLLKVISVIDGFTTVGAFLFFDGRFTVVLLDRSFIKEESGTPLAFVFGSFLSNIPLVAQSVASPRQSPYLLVSRQKHGFEMIIG